MRFKVFHFEETCSERRFFVDVNRKLEYTIVECFDAAPADISVAGGITQSVCKCFE